jgi:hypothetical protein
VSGLFEAPGAPQTSDPAADDDDLSHAIRPQQPTDSLGALGGSDYHVCP